MFKKQKVEIDWRGYMDSPSRPQRRTITVDAYVCRNLAIHRPVWGNEEPSPQDYGWTVTHIPTGQTVNSLFVDTRGDEWRTLTLKELKERVARSWRFDVAWALLDSLPWGSSANALPDADKARIRPLLNSRAYIRTGDESGISCTVEAA